MSIKRTRFNFFAFMVLSVIIGCGQPESSTMGSVAEMRHTLDSQYNAYRAELDFVYQQRGVSKDSSKVNRIESTYLKYVKAINYIDSLIVSIDSAERTAEGERLVDESSTNTMYLASADFYEGAKDVCLDNSITDSIQQSYINTIGSREAQEVRRSLFNDGDFTQITWFLIGFKQELTLIALKAFKECP
jgi:hypothetical protein